MAGEVADGSFLQAMVTPVPPLELDVEDDVLRRLTAVVDAAGVVLVGETHGVAENVAILAWLVRHLGIGQVALEWAECPAEALRRFANGGRVELHELQPSVDGRITPQHFAAMRQLRQDGLDVDVVSFVPEVFDVPVDDPSQNSWERSLAEQLLASREDHRAVLAMAGGIHATVDPQPIHGPAATPIGRIFANDPTFAGKDSLYPMGWHVARTVTTAPVRIRYGGGTYSNLGAKQFARDPAIRGNALRLRDQQITVEITVATAALVPGDSRGTS